MTLEYSPKDFWNILNAKIREYPSGGSQVFPRRQTGRHDEAKSRSSQIFRTPLNHWRFSSVPDTFGSWSGQWMHFRLRVIQELQKRMSVFNIRMPVRVISKRATYVIVVLRHAQWQQHYSLCSSMKILLHKYSVSQPPDRGPVPGPGINYTGPQEILLEFITNLNVIIYLSTCHTVHISVLILFMIMP